MSTSKGAKAKLKVVDETDAPAASSQEDHLSAAAPVVSPVIACIVGWVPGEGPLVALPDDEPGSPGRRARSVVKLTAAEARAAAAQRQEVLVAFAHNAPETPIVVGLLQPDPLPEESQKEVVVDGERIVLRGEKQVELRCGQSAVILNETGLVVVKGATVETRARGVNRIRGGSVKIN